MRAALPDSKDRLGLVAGTSRGGRGGVGRLGREGHGCTRWRALRERRGGEEEQGGGRAVPRLSRACGSRFGGVGYGQLHVKNVLRQGV